MVQAAANYGDETAFRDGITVLGLLYAVGVRPGTTVWVGGRYRWRSKPGLLDAAPFLGHLK